MKIHFHVHKLHLSTPILTQLNPAFVSHHTSQWFNQYYLPSMPAIPLEFLPLRFPSDGIFHLTSDTSVAQSIHWLDWITLIVSQMYIWRNFAWYSSSQYLLYWLDHGLDNLGLESSNTGRRQTFIIFQNIQTISINYVLFN